MAFQKKVKITDSHFPYTNVGENIDNQIRRIEQISTNFNGQQKPYVKQAKNLDLTLDARLHWELHVKNKKKWNRT